MIKQDRDLYSKNKSIDYLNGYVEITERDFYPPYDDRLYCSGIDDIEDGDCYDCYVEYFWENYENDIYN